jgi:hypothetical protein
VQFVLKEWVAVRAPGCAYNLNARKFAAPAIALVRFPETGP